MDLAPNDFSLRVQLLRALKSPEWDDRSRVRGAVTLDGDLLAFFERLRANNEADWLGPGANPSAGQLGQVFLKMQNGQRAGVHYGYVVQNLTGLLRFDQARTEVVEPVYLADPNWATGEPNEAADFVRYRKTVELCQWLRERADVGEPDRLLFLLSEKLELPLDYDSADVAAASFDEMATLKQLLADDLHKDQRRAIAVRALIEMLGALQPDERFPYLLRNLADFAKRVKDGYALYAAEFSYEKIRDQVEAARIEIAGKLNKTISEIQNQVLAIPVASILVATQMKAGPDSWAANIALVVASAIFVLLMRMILRNQRDSLSVLGNETERQAILLRTEYKDVADRFDDVFKDLRARKGTQERRLDWVWYLVLAGFILSVIAAIWFSAQPAPPPPVCTPATAQSAVRQQGAQPPAQTPSVTPAQNAPAANSTSQKATPVPAAKPSP